MEITRDPRHLDAGESAFFQRELEHIKSKTYDTKYKELRYAALLPVSTEAPSGSEFITYYAYSQVGLAKIIADYANDFPRVDIYGEAKTAKVRGIGAAYGYSVVEIRRSKKEGKNLDQRKANAARRAVEQKLNEIAWSGDTSHGLQGFINFPGITSYSVQNGSGGAKTWASKTPDEIVADISGIVTDGVVAPTKGIERPTTLLLPISQYQYIMDTRMTGNSDKTIAQYILGNKTVEKIEWLDELDGAGVGATDRMMVYAADPEKVTLEIPQMFEQFEQDKKGGVYEVPCHAECGGVIVYYPQSIAYGDGI